MAAAYKVVNPRVTLRLSDMAYIPHDDGNRDYQLYVLWRSAGNTPDPADPDPVRPPAADYGTDVSDDQADQAAAAIANLRTYLGNATPTAAQRESALRIVIRLMLWILKRQGI